MWAHLTGFDWLGAGICWWALTMCLWVAGEHVLDAIEARSDEGC